MVRRLDERLDETPCKALPSDVLLNPRTIIEVLSPSTMLTSPLPVAQIYAGVELAD